jgi:hypothetical protein
MDAWCGVMQGSRDMLTSFTYQNELNDEENLEGCFSLPKILEDQSLLTSDFRFLCSRVSRLETMLLCSQQVMEGFGEQGSSDTTLNLWRNPAFFSCVMHWGPRDLVPGDTKSLAAK